MKQIYKLVEKRTHSDKTYELVVMIVDRKLRLECGEVPHPESDNGTRYTVDRLEFETLSTEDLPDMVAFIDRLPYGVRVPMNMMILQACTVYKFLHSPEDGEAS